MTWSLDLTELSSFDKKKTVQLDYIDKLYDWIDLFDNLNDWINVYDKNNLLYDTYKFLSNFLFWFFLLCVFTSKFVTVVV
jgi:hypothetical protein